VNLCGIAIHKVTRRLHKASLRDIQGYIIEQAFPTGQTWTNAQ
jgi:hypothetical protein